MGVAFVSLVLPVGQQVFNETRNCPAGALNREREKPEGVASIQLIEDFQKLFCLLDGVVEMGGEAEPPSTRAGDDALFLKAGRKARGVFAGRKSG